VLESRCNKICKELIFFSYLFVQKHIFLFLLQTRLLGRDLVSQSLSVLNFHTVGFRCFELGLDTSDLCVSLFEVDVITLSLSASSFEIFSTFLLLLLVLLFGRLRRHFRDRRLDTGGADFRDLEVFWLLLVLFLNGFLISLVQRCYGADTACKFWQLPVLGFGIYLIMSEWDV